MHVSVYSTPTARRVRRATGPLDRVRRQSIITVCYVSIIAGHRLSLHNRVWSSPQYWRLNRSTVVTLVTTNGAARPWRPVRSCLSLCLFPPLKFRRCRKRKIQLEPSKFTNEKHTSGKKTGGRLFVPYDFRLSK